MKLLAAAFRLYSSSIARFLRFFINKNRPPKMAATATSPTTMPAATPALLDPPPDFSTLPVAELLAVTKMVCPPTTVTTEGFEDVVADGLDEPLVEEGLSDDEDEDPPSAKSAVVVRPERYADTYLVPPPPISQVSCLQVIPSGW
jgi:hypothetical protein